MVPSGVYKMYSIFEFILLPKKVQEYIKKEQYVIKIL